ncbi:MAG: fatty acyl-AMP ligase [Sandaracinus sp.]|nr:fatty acyl-AMP ligase [Sandaracinus sp.]MCB9631009.1 fatty acyl-AMP ligase [Sandaracinus sp.]
MSDRDRPSIPLDRSIEADLGGESREFRVSIPDFALDDFRTKTWTREDLERERFEPYHPTLTHAFAYLAKEGGDRGVTLLPDRAGDPVEHRTWAELVAQSRQVAARLAGEGIGRGDRVLVVLPTSWEFLVTFFALGFLRAVPVPGYPPAMLERAELALDKLRRIADHAGVKMVITTRKIRLVIGELASDSRPIVSTERLALPGPTGPTETRFRRSEAAFVQYTSGSTGHPKGVVLSHGNLVANVHAMGQALQVNRHDVGVSWLPLFHDMGLIGVLFFCVYWRLPLVLMSPTAFLLDPRRWLQAITDYKATLSPAPNFGYSRCVKRVRDLEGLDLSTWRIALNGAEPVSAATLDEFVERFGAVGFRRSACLPVYGLAEASLAATFPQVGAEWVTDTVDREALAHGTAVPAVGPGSVRLVGCGAAVPGHEVWVADAEGAPLDEREVGHIVVKGPSVMQGYLDAPEATRAILRDDVLWTGDLGYFANGQLFVAGRVKDLIIVRGRNYHAEDVEVVAEQVEGLRVGCAVAFGVYDEDAKEDLLVIVAETKEDDEEAQKRIAEAVAERVQSECGIRVDEVVLVEPGTVPKTSSGKRQRALCRDLFLQGELHVRRTSKLRLALVFVRSGVGFASAQAKRLLRRRASGR